MRGRQISEQDFDIVAQVGSFVEIDEWGRAAHLEHDDTDWELCDFRIETGGGLYHIATRIEVTGRTIRYRRSEPWVRIAIIFPADPLHVDWYTGKRLSFDTVVHGWLLLTEREQVYNVDKADRLWAARQARAEALAAEQEERRAARDLAQAAALEAAQAEEARQADEIRKAGSRARSLEL